MPPPNVFDQAITSIANFFSDLMSPGSKSSKSKQATTAATNSTDTAEPSQKSLKRATSQSESIATTGSGYDTGSTTGSVLSTPARPGSSTPLSRSLSRLKKSSSSQIASPAPPSAPPSAASSSGMTESSDAAQMGISDSDAALILLEDGNLGSFLHDVNPKQPQRRVPLRELIKACTKKWSRSFRQDALDGDVEAMVLVGEMYLSGWGDLPKDRQEARRWFQQAARYRHRTAMEMLQRMDRQDREGLDAGGSTSSLDIATKG